MKNVNPKKLLALLLAVAMLTSVFCIMPVSAATDEVSTITCGDYTYTLAEDGTAVIAGYTGTETDVTIPTELDGKRVSGIGDHSFEKNSTIENLTIPSGVTLGANSFWFSTKLKKVTLKDGVTTVGRNAFSFCDALEEIDMPNSVTTIERSAFQNCEMLKNITFSNQLETIGDFAFSGCLSFTDLEIPASLTEIGQNSFAYCSGFTSIEIPGTVKLISNGAFSYCDNLASVTLNEGIDEVRIYAFANCLKLMEVTVPDSVQTIGRCSFGYYFDKDVWNDVQVPGFVLKGYRGSAADSYAQDFGVKFESIGDSILTPPTTAGPTEPTTAPAPGTVNTIYFKNTANYASPYAYYWSSATDSGPNKWPGVAMEKVTDDVYKVNVPAEYDMIIFNNNGNGQTGNLNIGGNNMIYDGSKWEAYAEETTPSETESQETTAPSETTSEDTTPTVTESQETTAPSETTSEDTTPTATESQETTASTETEPAPVFDYYVVGSPELFGVSWAEDSANGMTKGDDGNYYLTIENAPAGEFSFKVKDSNGGWHPDGMGNDGVVTTTGGEKVIFCYNPDAGVAIVSTDGQVPTYPTKPTETEPTAPTETEPTQPTECDHATTKTVGAKSATYFEKGYTGDKVCADCGEVVAKGKATDKKVLKTPKVTVKVAKKAIKVTYKNNIKDAKGFKVTYKLGKKTYTKKFTLTKKELKKAKVTKTIKVKKSGKYKVTVKAFVTSGKKIAYSDATKAVTSY